uniref:protein-tyrosine-phosphatase n=1 Tax=Hemiscolopendra marginata TaxID=943146 RepID=A0A646QCN0_9MYRI
MNSAAPLLFAFCVFTSVIQVSQSAEVVIQFPPSVSQLGSDVSLRLNYRPPVGKPPANFSFHPADIEQSTVSITDAIPGSEYVFELYFTNRTMSDFPSWSDTFYTIPDEPANFSVIARSTKTAQIAWLPPLKGGFTELRLRVIPKTEATATSVRIIQVERDKTPFTLKDLTPGATYQLQLVTVFHKKESRSFISTFLTTKPNAPGRFIVWFRNETTLLVLWQPPYPPGVFNQYKASIEPRDAVHSEVFVEKEVDPPGPAQADFNELIPGRNYNITVQTVSGDQLSAGTSAQYRTVPSAPRNISFNKNLIRPDSFTVTWEPPKMPCEFERYHVSLGIRLKTSLIVDKENDRVAKFTEGLEPGTTYEVVVKTVSGNVASWPTSGNVTTRPLPVIGLNASSLNKGEIHISWTVSNFSTQDSFKIYYQDVEAFNDDGGLAGLTKEHSFVLHGLLDGHNYSITVVASSNGMESDDATIYQATIPVSPIIKYLEPVRKGLNISWKSDVTSKQDSFEIMYMRNDTGEHFRRVTKDDRILLDDLYAGALYELKIYAISYGLHSEPHTFHQAVYPNSPRNLSVTPFGNSTFRLTWLPPENSLYEYYSVKYRSYGLGNSSWIEKGPIYNTSTDLNGLYPGNKYTIAIFSVSHKVESIDAKKVDLALTPQSITDMETTIDSQNVTFRWLTPMGYVERFLLIYTSSTHPEKTFTKEVSSNSTTGQPITVVINDLFPGEQYAFQIFTVSHGAKSDPYVTKTRTKPLILSDAVMSPIGTRSISLRYTLTPSEATIFDHYRFQLSDPSIPIQERLQNDTHRLVTFTNLTPGRLYDITIWTVSENVLSNPIRRQDRLYPAPISDMNATGVTDSEITLVWKPPPGEHSAYEIQYLTPEVLNQNITRVETIVFKNLRPHKNYTFTVIVLSGEETSLLKRSTPFSKHFQTLEATPGKVHFFRAKDIKPNEITLQWSLSDFEQNGILVGFTISYGFKGYDTIGDQEFGADVTSGVLNNLEPGRIYVFTIRARTKIGHGPSVKLEETMPIWPPPTPSPQVVPSDISRSSTTIRIRFRKSYFSSANGVVKKYAVIVAEDDEIDSTNLDLPTWYEVQSISKWPPYQVNEPYNPFLNTTVEEFTIGAGGCSENTRFCNGPLKPGTGYKVKIRAFTAPNKFTDTMYSPIIATDKDNTSVIIVAVVVPLIILLTAIIAIILLKKRRGGPFTKKTSKRNVPGKEDSLSIPESIIETSRPVKLKDFPEHFRLMSADSDFRFSEEYEELKMVGRDLPRTAADLPVNRPKNRFTNILPYDHSRVKLLPTDDEEGSDYINANYVSGYNSPREFIVTQGPLHSTRDDLWRMVWEQNCRAIVMLTRCIEKGREKCDHYWPYDTQPTYYGDIQVTILNESQYTDWTISEFKVCRGDHSRVVRHFHFTTWPDFGVPDPPQSLIRFVRAFRERIPPDQKPIVAHCSAGVGRSGTFIALDRLLQHIQTYDYVDIFGIVYEMRKERVWMVQTEQQYICIHQCLLCVLEGRENDNPPREVHENEGFEDDEGIAESGM